MEKRYYRFFVRTYATPLEFQNLLDTSFKYAYIYHDKDNVEPHYHILLSFKQNKSFDAVKKLVDSDQNTFVEPLHDPWSAYCYLTHCDNSGVALPDKYIYSSGDIVSNDTAYWFKTQGGLNSISPSNEEFVYDLLDSDLSMREMAVKYGRDYIKNYRAYEYFKHEYKKLNYLEKNT